MLKDDLQACLVSGYSFIGCSKFDQVDGYFGRGATKCNYRGVAEMAFAQGACLFAETLTKGLHKVVWFPNPLAAGSQMGSSPCKLTKTQNKTFFTTHPLSPNAG